MDIDTHDDDTFSEDRPPLPPKPPVPTSDALPPPPAPAPLPVRYPEKSPALAAFLSVVPGIGHLYTERYQRAVIVVTAFFLSIYLLPLPLSVFVPIFIWFFGLFDSYRQAQLVNLSTADEPPAPRVRECSLAFGVFLTIVGVILLVDRFIPIELDWLLDWWPALLVLGGLYFIWGAWREREAGRVTDRDSDSDLD